MNEPDLENLKRWAHARREELDLTHLEIQLLGGPSTTTMTKIEAARGPAPRRDVMRRLEQALQWERGSVRRVLDGGEPTPRIADRLLGRDIDELREAVRASREAGRTTDELVALILDSETA